MRQILLIALVVSLLGCQPSLGGPGPDGPGAARIGREPAAAAAFVGSFARGDEAGADDVASPLYRYEWARRAVSVEDRLAVVPHRSRRTPSSPEWIRFRFEGGVRDAHGFGHLIYTARPPAWAGEAASSVWRVDLDPESRVIWCELVWLFSDDTDTVELVRDHPTGVGAGTVLLGVRSTSGGEGYYALAPAGALDPGAPPSSLLFLAVDTEAGARVGAWSYGVPSYAGSSQRRSPPPAAPPEVVRMRTSYIETL